MLLASCVCSLPERLETVGYDFLFTACRLTYKLKRTSFCVILRLSGISGFLVGSDSEETGSRANSSSTTTERSVGKESESKLTQEEKLESEGEVLLQAILEKINGSDAETPQSSSKLS